jgi:hypothetical protein
MKCPCKGCTDRTVTCHGVCKRYEEWKKEHEIKKKWLRDQAPYTSEGALKGHRERIRKIQRGQLKSRTKNYD